MVVMAGYDEQRISGGGFDRSSDQCNNFRDVGQAKCSCRENCPKFGFLIC